MIKISKSTLVELKHNYFASVITVVCIEFAHYGLANAARILMLYVLLYIYFSLMFNYMIVKEEDGKP